MKNLETQLEKCKLDCSLCSGSGVVEVICKICKGTGWVGGHYGKEIYCGGFDEATCPKCKGEGYE